MPDDDIYRSSYLDYTLDESTMCMKKRESNLHESKAESKEDQWEEPEKTPQKSESENLSDTPVKGEKSPKKFGINIFNNKSSGKKEKKRYKQEDNILASMGMLVSVDNKEDYNIEYGNKHMHRETQGKDTDEKDPYNYDKLI